MLEWARDPRRDTVMFLHCPTCCSGFASQLALQDHVKTHMKAEAPSDCTCQVCGKVFSKRDHLRRHEATHSEIRPHKCHLCQSTFKRKDKLTAHLSTNHGIPSVSPTYGLKRIPPGSRMKEEEGSPSPGSSSAGRDFVCGFCFMGFTRKYHLDRHTSASHSGVKAHQCLDCGRRFTRKDHMERHQMTHLGVKPYGCTLCDKSFTRKERLAEHLASHQSALTGSIAKPRTATT